MCLIKSFIKCILGIINGLVMTVGLILMGIGGVCLWGMNTLLPKILNLTNHLKDALTKIGVSNADKAISGIEKIVQSNSNTIGTVFFVAGCVLVAIAILGYISLCCLGFHCVLYVLIVLVTALIVALIAFTSYYSINGEDSIMGHVEEGLRKFMKEYQGNNATNTGSLIINLIQSQAHCCGINNYTDYANLPNWTPPVSTQKFPASCCENRNFQYVDLQNCLDTNTSPYMNHGCYGTIKPYVEKYLRYAYVFSGISIAALVLLDALLIGFVYCEKSVKK